MRTTRLITQRLSKNTWESGLCNCCGDKEHSWEQCRFFCCALWCQCCAQGELLRKSGLSDECCVPCMFYCFTSSFSNIIPCIAICNLRNSVAHISGVKEATCSSCLKVCFCTPCALNQINTQLILTEKRFKVDPGCSLAHLMGSGPVENSYFMPNSGSPGMQNSMNHS